MICPRCGAENQPSAKICRMCATPLEAANAANAANIKQNNFSPGVATSTAGVRDGKSVNTSIGTTPGPGEILCPTCKAVNDATWAYCQQCGSQLHKMGMPKSMPAAVPVLPVNSKPTTNAAPPQVQPAQPLVPPLPPSVPPMISPSAPAANQVRNENVATNGGISCLSCGRVNSPGSSYCATCGAALSSEQVSAVSRVAMPKLRLIQEGGGDGEIYKLDSEETIIGRNSGDIRFPHDGYMSGRHARIIRRGSHFVLIDENSRNGTFKRIDGEVELKAGDIILIGKQLFRFEL